MLISTLFSLYLLSGPVVQVTCPVCPLQRSLQSHEAGKLPEVRPRLAQLLEAGPQTRLLRNYFGICPLPCLCLHLKGPVNGGVDSLKGLNKILESIVVCGIGRREGVVIILIMIIRESGSYSFPVETTITAPRSIL